MCCAMGKTESSARSSGMPSPRIVASFEARTERGAPLRISPAPSPGRLHQRIIGDHLVDESVGVRLGGGKPLAGEQHRHRGVVGNVARQPVDRPPAAAISPTRGSGSPNDACSAADDDVAGEHQLEPAAERESVHRRDDRLEAARAAGQSAEAARQPAPQLAHVLGAVLGLELQIVARAERLLPCPGQDRHPLVRILLERVERLFHLPSRVGMQSVHHPRAIDGHGG